MNSIYPIRTVRHELIKYIRIGELIHVSGGKQDHNCLVAHNESKFDFVVLDSCAGNDRLLFSDFVSVDGNYRQEISFT